MPTMMENLNSSSGFQRSKVFSTLPTPSSKKKDMSSDEFMVTDLHA